MKRTALLLVLGGLVAIIARPSAMIPDQVRVDTACSPHRGLDAADGPRVQGHSVCGSTPWGEPVARAATGGQVGRCTAGGRLRRSMHRWRPTRGRGGGRGAAAPGAPGAPGLPGAQAPPREPARSEDCSTPNVWTSANSPNDKRPVMVWDLRRRLHGGSGGLAWYDGENLAAKGPVIVTFNYRLGSLGSSPTRSWPRRPAIPARVTTG